MAEDVLDLFMTPTDIRFVYHMHLLFVVPRCICIVYLVRVSNLARTLVHMLSIPKVRRDKWALKCELPLKGTLL